jgi:GNAT superfamily N-acetyltransferase
MREVPPTGSGVIACAMPDTGPVVRFRNATTADASALAAFARRTFEEAYRAVMAPDLMARVLRDQFGPDRQTAEIAAPGAAWVVAEVENMLAGYAYLRSGRVPEVGAPRDPVELARFYVDGVWHGRGVARVLMDAAVRQALQMGGRTLWLAVWQRNPRAMAFYRKYGFRTIGVCSWEQTPGALEDDLMLLELEAGLSA